MKRVFGLLTLLICLELIVAPMAPSLGFMQKAFAEDESSCRSKGLNFNPQTNRCNVYQFNLGLP